MISTDIRTAIKQLHATLDTIEERVADTDALDATARVVCSNRRSTETGE